MVRQLFSCVLLIALVCFRPGTAAADAMPDGYRPLTYRFTVKNLDDFPDYVFYVYPTWHGGIGYVFENGKGLFRLMRETSWKGPGTELWAMKRAEYQKLMPRPVAYHSGDQGELLYLVKHPPGPPRALPASFPVEPPELVKDDDPVWGIHKVFRIASITDSRFDLRLESEITVYKDHRAEETVYLADGGVTKRAVPEPPPPPKPQNIPPEIPDPANAEPPQRWPFLFLGLIPAAGLAFWLWRRARRRRTQTRSA